MPYCSIELKLILKVMHWGERSKKKRDRLQPGHPHCVRVLREAFSRLFSPVLLSAYFFRAILMDARCEMTRLITMARIKERVCAILLRSSFLDTKQWDFQTLLLVRLTPKCVVVFS